jgi:hypothetical protein
MKDKNNNSTYSDKKIKKALKLKFEDNLSLTEISLATDIPKEYIRKLVQGKIKNDMVMEYLLKSDFKKLDF